MPGYSPVQTEVGNFRVGVTAAEQVSREEIQRQNRLTMLTLLLYPSKVGSRVSLLKQS